VASYNVDDDFIKEFLRLKRKIDGIRGPGITNNPDYINFPPPTGGRRGGAGSPQPGVIVIVKITGHTSPTAFGTAKYYGRIMTGTFTAAADATGFTMPSGMTTPDADDALVVNLNEDTLLNTGSGHDLPVGHYLFGMQTGETASGLSVVITDGFRVGC
jgi:hypothetical protein